MKYLSSIIFPLLISASALQAESISGRVTDSSSPLSAMVRVSSSQVAYYTSTDTNGDFIFNNLPPEIYRVMVISASKEGIVYQPKLYPNLPCPLSSCVIDDGSPFLLRAGENLKDINFVLSPGTVIKGTVKGESNPISARIQVWTPSGDLIGELGNSPDTGAFTISGLAPGEYRLSTRKTTSYVDEVTGPVVCIRNCEADDVKAGASVLTSLTQATEVNFNLKRGSSLSGKVLEEGNSMPIIGASVRLYTADGKELAGYGLSDSAGVYNLSEGLPAGVYRLRALANGYFPSVYVCSGCTKLSMGSAILVKGPVEIPNINFSVLSPIACKDSNDDDIDGVRNCKDSCPTDVAKITPGRCGCGVADTDANFNGINDCFATLELGAQIDNLYASVRKLNKRSVKAAYGVRSDIRARIAEFKASLQATKPELLGTAANQAKIARLNKQLLQLTRELYRNKKYSADVRKKALRTLVKLKALIL